MYTSHSMMSSPHGDVRDSKSYIKTKHGELHHGTAISVTWSLQHLKIQEPYLGFDHACGAEIEPEVARTKSSRPNLWNQLTPETVT